MTDYTSSSSEAAPNLTNVTAVGRKVVKYTIIGIVAFMILRLLVSSFVRWWAAMNPEPPPPPTVGFGKLPAINFPDQEIENDYQYTLETPRNRLPEFSDRAKVISMQKFRPSLLADERVRDIADAYGFDGEPEMLDSYNYRWIRYQPLETVLDINLYNYNFSLSSDYLTRSELMSNSGLPDDMKAVADVKSFLSRTDLLPADMATAAGTVNYAKALGGEMVEAVSLSDADFLQVDLNRFLIDGEYKLFTPGGREGIVRAVIAGSLTGRERMVAFDYRYQPADYATYETYPLRPINQAWEDLKAGRSYVAEHNHWEASGEVVIREVVLGYYDDFSEQEFLQPIYVFIGDNDFSAYVLAIEAEFYEE